MLGLFFSSRKAVDKWVLGGAQHSQVFLFIGLNMHELSMCESHDLTMTVMNGVQGILRYKVVNSFLVLKHRSPIWLQLHSLLFIALTFKPATTNQNG